MDTEEGVLEGGKGACLGDRGGDWGIRIKMKKKVFGDDARGPG